METQGIFLLVAILVIVAVIVVWIMAGNGSGSKNGESAAGQAVDDSALEFTQVALEEKGPEGELAKEIADAERDLHADLPPAEPGKPRIAPAVGAPDDLRKIKGVGPKLNAMLTDMGITRYDQIAAFTSEDIAEIDPYLGSFKGRIVRDNWIEQARFLAAGDVSGFEAKFGKL